MCDEGYLSAITEWLYEFYSDIPPILWEDATKKILKPEGYGAMFRILLEKGFFKDSKEITKDVARFSGILLPHTIIEGLIDMSNDVYKKIKTNI